MRNAGYRFSSRRRCREIIQDGISGFVVEDKEGAIRAVKDIDRLDRRLVRKDFEERFSAASMAQAHIDIYRKMTP